MGSPLRYSVNNQNIGTLIFDLPNEKVNKISVPILEELEKLIDKLASQPPINALVIKSGKEGAFIAGADLKGFEPLFSDQSGAKKLINTGHRVFDKLSKLPFPTIAAIDGACLGGGLELALACTYRVVSDRSKTSLGLPEVSLGIIPGWGGTQRLPRLVGLTEGLKMIVSGKSVTAIQAWKIKLADAIYPAEFFSQGLEEFIRNCTSEKGRKDLLDRRNHSGLKSVFLEKNFIGRSLVYRKTEQEIQKKTKGHYPAPLVALNLIKSTYSLPIDLGLAKEAETFVSSMSKEFQVAPHLIQLFFNQEALKKNPGGSIQSSAAHQIHTAGVIGSGVMGSGIAWLFTYSDIPVRMKDVSWDIIGKGSAAVWDNYQTMIKIRKLKQGEANIKFHRLAGVVDYRGFKNLDLIIEAATENVELKRKIFKELEAEVRADAILATNTSSLSIDTLSVGMQHPERFVGMHFFNPPSRMPLVEVVAGKHTSPEALATAVEICKTLKKTPIVVRDCPGFLVNRIFAAGEIQVLAMLEEGVEFQRLEKLLVDFGMPMAPFILADEVGNDVNYKVLKIFEQAYGERMKAPALLAAMNERKLYGKKAGRGFYLYNNKKEPRFNPEILELLPQKKISKNLTDKEVVERVILSMINEGSRCLEEKVISEPMHLDMAMILGTGFPPFRGGLLRYADSLGTSTVLSKMKELNQRYGVCFAPSRYLEDLGRSNKTFY